MLDFLTAGRTQGELLCLVIAATIAGLARGFSGFGAALIFMPLASAAIGPRMAAPLLLAIDAVMALGLIPNAWRRADKRAIVFMALGAAVGIPLGTVILTVVDPLMVRWSIAVVVVLLLALLVSGWRYRGTPTTLLTMAVGGLSGLFGGAAQIGGPPVMAYWLGGSLPIDRVRANIVIYFVCSTVFTMASYLFGNLITWPVLSLALMSGPFYGAGLCAGSYLFGRTNEAVFRRLSYGLIAIAALISLPVLDPLIR